MFCVGRSVVEGEGWRFMELVYSRRHRSWETVRSWSD